MLNRNTCIRRKITKKNNYFLPLIINWTQGYFSFKLDNFSSNTCHQFFLHTYTQILPPKTFISRIINNCCSQIGRSYYNQRKFTHIQTNYCAKDIRYKCCYVIVPVRLLYLLWSSLNHLALCLLLSIFPRLFVSSFIIPPLNHIQFMGGAGGAEKKRMNCVLLIFISSFFMFSEGKPGTF